MLPKPSKVLVVDDDREIALGMTMRLRSVGCDVSAVYNGESALSAARESVPDAMVLDIRMPGIDGMEVLRRLQQDERLRSVPVIICSASLVDRKDALDQGASYFVQKPYEPATLIEAVSAVLAGEPRDLRAARAVQQIKETT